MTREQSHQCAGSNSLPPVAGSQVSSKHRPFDLNAVRVYAAFIIVLAHWMSYCNATGLTISPLISMGFFYGVADPALAIFLIFSGMTMSFSTEQVKGVRTYVQFLSDKFLRLVVPYVSLNLVGYLLLYLLPSIYPFNTMQGRQLPELLLRPELNIGGTTWYLCFLTVVFAFWPLLGWLTSQKGLPWLFTGSVVLSVLPLQLTEVLDIQRLVFHLPTLIFGAWIGISARDKDCWIRIAVYGGIFVTTIAVLFTLYYFRVETQSVRKHWFALSTINAISLARSISGGLFWIQVVGLIGGRFTKARKFFTSWAVLSLDIFLLHKPFVLFPLLLALQTLHPGPLVVYVMLVPMAAVAFVASAYLGKGLRRLSLLSRLFLGVVPRRSISSAPAKSTNR